MALALVLTVALSQTGCVRRRMTVRTNPPGAVVYVDEQRIGVSPVSTNFIYYGTRNVQVAKDGYETVKEKHRLAPPWYQYPVIDFFAENLWPFELRDERVLDFELPPQQATSPAKVMDRAGQLRSSAQQGLVTPMIPPQGQTTAQQWPGTAARQ
jgi:hypothetical protein